MLSGDGYAEILDKTFPTYAEAETYVKPLVARLRIDGEDVDYSIDYKLTYWDIERQRLVTVNY